MSTKKRICDGDDNDDDGDDDDHDNENDKDVANIFFFNPS